MTIRIATQPETGLVLVAGIAAEELKAILRRDWDVRVLDAWATQTEGEVALYLPYEPTVLLTNGGKARRRTSTSAVDTRSDSFRAATTDAARHAGALAVFPTLSDAKRAELGECP